MKAISIIAAGVILLAAQAQAQASPEVVATGSNGDYATFVVTQDGVVKACSIKIDYDSIPVCHTIPKR